MWSLEHPAMPNTPNTYIKYPNPTVYAI